MQLATIDTNEANCLHKSSEQYAFPVTHYSQDDKFSTEDGGLVYAVIVNLTKRWVGVIFRGTIGLTDANTDRDFRLDEKSFFESEDFINVPGGKPATHKGFTEFLFSARAKDSTARPYVDRILACVDCEFENNPDVKGKGFKLFVSGHSLGGGLSNLFAFRVAQLKSRGHESVKHLPTTVKCMSFAAPCVGNHDFNKEYQVLEQKGFLRHIRVSNEGDAVPTNNIPPPFSFALMGSAYNYTQNGVNIFLRPKEDMVVSYRNTKDMWSQTGLDSISIHGLPEYEKRLALPANKEIFKQTIEELYQEAKDFTAQECLRLVLVEICRAGSACGALFFKLHSVIFSK